MRKILSIVVLTAAVALSNAPAHARSDCAYAITKLEAQIGFQKSTKDTSAASAAAAEAAAYDAKAQADRAKGATVEAAQNDAACRKSVLSGWNALHG